MKRTTTARLCHPRRVRMNCSRLHPTVIWPDVTNLFRFDEMVAKAGQASNGNHDLPYEDIAATGSTENHPYRRLIERAKTLYWQG